MAAKGNNLTQRCREAEVAETVRLGGYVSEYSERNSNGNVSSVYSVTNSRGFVPSTDYFNKEVFSKTLTTYKIVSKGSFAYNPSRINVGSVGLYGGEDEGIVSPLYVTFTADTSKIDNQYLLAFLKSNIALRQIRNLTAGSVRDSLKFSALGKLLLPLPSLPAQRRIAAELDKICELKKNAETRLEKLDLFVKSRFAEMFGESQVWRKVGLLEAGECKNGINFAPNECGYELRCIGVSNFKNFAEISNLESMSLVSLNARPSDDLLLRDGDMLFVRSNGNKNLVGRCVVVHPGDSEVTFSGFCIRYRLTSKKLDALYVVHYLRQSQVRRLLQGRGANIQNMSQRTLAGLSIPIPPLALQRKFAAFVAKVEKLKDVAKKSVEQMDILYRAKLQEYFG